VPCIPGYEGAPQDGRPLTREAHSIGYPLMIRLAPVVAAAALPGHTASRTESQLKQCAARRPRPRFGSDELIPGGKPCGVPAMSKSRSWADQHGNLFASGLNAIVGTARHQKGHRRVACPVMTTELRPMHGEAATKAARR